MTTFQRVEHQVNPWGLGLRGIGGFEFSMAFNAFRGFQWFTSILPKKRDSKKDLQKTLLTSALKINPFGPLRVSFFFLKCSDPFSPPTLGFAPTLGFRVLGVNLTRPAEAT